MAVNDQLQTGVTLLLRNKILYTRQKLGLVLGNGRVIVKKKIVSTLTGTRAQVPPDVNLVV